MSTLRRAEADLKWVGEQALTLNSTAVGLNSTVAGTHVVALDMSITGGAGANIKFDSTGPVVGTSGGLRVPSGSLIRWGGMQQNLGDLKICKANSTAAIAYCIGWEYVGDGGA